MSGHTPGPWSAHKIDEQEWEINSKWEINSNGEPKLGYVTWRGMCIVYGCDDEPEKGSGIAEANAHLIASSPDLLEALDYIVGWMEGAKGDRNLFLDDAYKAIAKARGE